MPSSKKNKTYRPQSGLIVGRFQCFHQGHEFMVRTALELCEHVYLYIGSSQVSRTEKNPFSYDERKQMIEMVFRKEVDSGRLHIMPLPDQGIGDNPRWGKFILDTVSKDFGITPSLYISGCEKERQSWFTEEVAPYMDELRLARNSICDGVSATECRKCLRNDEGIERWAQLVPAELVDAYEMMKGIYNETTA